MNLARVAGHVVVTRRVAELGPQRLVVLAPEGGGVPLVALDPLVGASAGSRVWYVNGSDAVDALDVRQPVDAVVVGLADTVSE
ncbi:MAG: EutN/CcmL family microcompartment protein [Gaiellales bacterium]